MLFRSVHRADARPCRPTRRSLLGAQGPRRKRRTCDPGFGRDGDSGLYGRHGISLRYAPTYPLARLMPWPYILRSCGALGIGLARKGVGWGKGENVSVDIVVRHLL